MDMKNNNNHNLHLPDWQRGEYSTLTPIERVEEMNKWLKSNNQEIINKLKASGIQQEEDIVGFPD